MRIETGIADKEFPETSQNDINVNAVRSRVRAKVDHQCKLNYL